MADNMSYAGGSATFNESMPQTGGMNIGGTYYSPEQIKQFYQGGGNDAQFAAQNGLGRDEMLQARQIAGVNPTTQQYFQQYQAANPTGAFANNYQGWLGDQAPHRLDAMKSGTFTGDGADKSPLDYYNAYAGTSGTNLGMGAPAGNAQYQAYQSGNYNPYLKEMGNTIVNQMTDNYNRNQLPAMRSGAVAAGGFGGSRQGVVEANGLNDLNRGIGQNLTNLYGQDWTNAQNRNLQQQSINNSYDLGLKSNDLGYANLDSNNQQFGANYGLNVLNAQNQWAQNGVQATTNMQNTPANYQTMFNQQQNQIAGQGGTSTNTQNNQGNPWLGALGGAQMANTWLK